MIVNIGRGVAGGLLGTVSFITVQHFKEIALNSIKEERNKDFVKLGVGTLETVIGAMALIYAIDHKGIFWRAFNLVFGISEMVAGGKSVLEATLSLIHR